MKNALLILSLLFIHVQGFSQKGALSIFDKSNNITWLGVDITQVRFVGPVSGWGKETTKDPQEIRDKYAAEWNEYLLKEKIELAVHRSYVNREVDLVKKMNYKADVKNMFDNDMTEYQLLDENKVKALVKKYNFGDQKGIGFMLIAEGFSKTIEQGSFWATFVDMGSGKVLMTKRVTGKAFGFGFRNYWLGSMKNALKTVAKEYNSWEK